MLCLHFHYLCNRSQFPRHRQNPRIPSTGQPLVLSNYSQVEFRTTPCTPPLLLDTRQDRFQDEGRQKHRIFSIQLPSMPRKRKSYRNEGHSSPLPAKSGRSYRECISNLLGWTPSSLRPLLPSLFVADRHNLRNLDGLLLCRRMRPPGRHHTARNQDWLRRCTTRYRSYVCTGCEDRWDDRRHTMNRPNSDYFCPLHQLT